MVSAGVLSPGHNRNTGSERRTVSYRDTVNNRDHVSYGSVIGR